MAAAPTSVDDRPRCGWVDLSKPDYVAYHDREWGVPVIDDRLAFEFLTLESAQAGLSWYTILKKREAYRLAFDDFDPEKVARYDEEKQGLLLQNAGIVRNRLKIAAAISNARLFLDLRDEFGSFTHYIWQFVNGRPIVNAWPTSAESPTTTPESDALSQDLKRRGFKFVGSTICYAHMQATGLVNDHTLTCFRRQEIIDRYPEWFAAAPFPTER